MAELKPCPFCGGEAQLTHAPYAGTVFIQCLNCSAMMGRYNKTTLSGHKNFIVSFENEDEIIKAWNRRVKEKAEAGYWMKKGEPHENI